MAPPPVRWNVWQQKRNLKSRKWNRMIKQEAKPLLKEVGGNAMVIESEEKKRPRAVAEAEPHKSERNCELKLDLDKSDHVGVINKHHVQKQQQQQQQLSVPDKTAQATPMPLHMSMPDWPGGLPAMGQAYLPTEKTALKEWSSGTPRSFVQIWSLSEVDPVAEEKYGRQVMESGGFHVDLFFQPFGGIVPNGCTLYDTLFGKVGLHCYNIEKGTNLQFNKVTKVNGQIASLFNIYITLEAMDPVHDSPFTFQTCVTDAVPKYQARLRMFTNTCRIKPQLPGTGNGFSRWDPDEDVDDSCKVDLPDWLQDDALTGPDKLVL